jgi:hypothetical protein
MKESNREDLPISHEIHLFKDMFFKTQINIDRIETILYTLVIGSIMYVMLCTRLHISYDLSIISIYQSNLGEDH